MSDKNKKAHQYIIDELKKWGGTDLASAVSRDELSCQTACKKLSARMTTKGAREYWAVYFGYCERMDI